jgi:hypothetical protein
LSVLQPKFDRPIGSHNEADQTLNGLVSIEIIFDRGAASDLRAVLNSKDLLA